MLKPNFKTIQLKKEKNYGEFVLSPLEQGYGHTVGNALRRVLLTSLFGAALTQVKIKGVYHQFATLKGLKEDIVDFCLNLKQIRIKIKKGEGPFKITIDARGPGEIKASDIKAPPEIEIVNKTLLLGHLADNKSRLQAEMKVEKGVGYRLAAEEKKKIGLILLDSIFTPVVRVGYEIKPTRDGRRTDLDKLILKIWTDGTIDSKMALKEAAKILVSHFQQIYKPVFEKEKGEEKTETEKTPLPVMNLSIEEIGLPTRIANSLAKKGFDTVSSLCRARREEVLKTKNFGEKSLLILEKILEKKGVKFAA